jgi:undecaprenyl-diphosphatase
MNDSDLSRLHRRSVYSYEKEKQKKNLAYLLLLTGFFVFLLTITGITDGLSGWIDYFLLDSLGYTNKWSKTYGPSWFVHTVNDISALGGKVLFFFIVLSVAVYYKIRKEYALQWKFLFVVLAGTFILFLIKLLFSDDIPYDPVELFISDIGGYPSGHTMIAIILYMTIAVLLTRRQRRQVVRTYTLISASTIIFLVGISRILAAKHDVTEVLAGWSLGLIWICICWLVERFIKINYNWEI